jgi:hypothetical protein
MTDFWGWDERTGKRTDDDRITSKCEAFHCAADSDTSIAAWYSLGGS